MITLNARLDSDLNWQIPPLSHPVDWYLDLGLSELPKPLNDEGQFAALELALLHFRDTVWQPSLTHAVYLYRGPVKEVDADYLKALTRNLPDDMPLALLLDVSSCQTLYEEVALTSRARFDRFKVHVKGSKLPLPSEKVGICLPASNGEALEPYLQTPHRLIPESYLMAEWDGLDTLIVAKNSLTPQLQRKLQGFEAAGGTVLFI